MTIGSGKFGVVNGVTKVRDWSMSIVDSGETYRDSSTRAGTVRNSGIFDATGQFSVNDGTPVLYPGGYFKFEGYPLPTSGVYDSDGVIWTIDTAIIESFSSTWNWGKTQSLTSIYNYAQGTACPTFVPGHYLDTSVVTPAKMCGLGFTISVDDLTWVSYLNMVSATFTLSCANQEVNNSTYGCCTARTPGNVDWTLSITEENDYNIVGYDDITPITVDIGQTVSLRLYVTAATYWDLSWGILQSWNDLVVDRDSGRIVQKTCNYAMNGIYLGALGFITAPGAGTNYWPPVVPPP
jgi:hypothetical protein